MFVFIKMKRATHCFVFLDCFGNRLLRALIYNTTISARFCRALPTVVTPQEIIYHLLNWFFYLFERLFIFPQSLCHFLSVPPWNMACGPLSRHGGVCLSVCLFGHIVVSSVNEEQCMIECALKSIVI